MRLGSLKRQTCIYMDDGAHRLLFVCIPVIPCVFHGMVGGVQIKAAIDEKAQLLLFFGVVGGRGGVFFAQHLVGMRLLGAGIGQVFADKRFVDALRGKGLFEPLRAVFLAFAVDVGFGVAFVGLPVALGKFGEHGFQFVGVFGVGGEFAVELLAADFAAG